MWALGDVIKYMNEKLRASSEWFKEAFKGECLHFVRLMVTGYNLVISRAREKKYWGGSLALQKVEGWR